MRLPGPSFPEPALWLVGAGGGFGTTGRLGLGDGATTTLLVVLSAAAMLLASLLLGFVRRRVLDLLGAWAEAAPASPSAPRPAAPRAGD